MEWFLLSILLLGVFWQLFSKKDFRWIPWDNYSFYLDHYHNKWSSKAKTRGFHLAKK